MDEIKISRRVISAGLLFVYFFTQVLYTHAVETSLWSNRRPLPSLDKPISPFRALLNSIPSSYGFIRDVHESTNGSHAPVLLIQDVHLNPEAQRNIASLLIRLMERNQAGVIGVEGAFNPIKFSELRSLADESIKRNVADDFLSAGLLAAPSYAGLLSRAIPPLIFGVDDERRYRKNVKAYLDSGKNQEAVDRELSGLSEELGKARANISSVDLLRLDQLRVFHQQGTLPFDAYVEALAAFHPELPPALEQFLQAARLEKTLNFHRAEQELQLVLQRLASVLSKAEMEVLLAKSLAFRRGQSRFASFYGHLKARCARYKIDLSQVPALNSYIRYVLIADDIRGNEIFESVDRLENQTVKALARSSDERDWAALSQGNFLVRKLVRFSLTPVEWRRYKKSEYYGTRDSLKTFESFYEEADVRSRVMAIRLTEMKSDRMRVLVAGGFHTPDIAAELRSRNISYAVFSPRVTRINEKQGAAYLSAFSREKTPLDKLFEGERLFINPSTTNFSWLGLKVRFWAVSESMRSGALRVRPSFLEPPQEFAVVPGERPHQWDVSPVMAEAASTKLLWEIISIFVFPTNGRKAAFIVLWEFSRLFFPFLAAIHVFSPPWAQFLLGAFAVINVAHFIFVDHAYLDGRSALMLSALTSGYLTAVFLIGAYPVASVVLIATLSISHGVFDYRRMRDAYSEETKAFIEKLIADQRFNFSDNEKILLRGLGDFVALGIASTAFIGHQHDSPAIPRSVIPVLNWLLWRRNLRLVDFAHDLGPKLETEGANDEPLWKEYWPDFARAVARYYFNKYYRPKRAGKTPEIDLDHHLNFVREIDSQVRPGQTVTVFGAGVEGFHWISNVRGPAHIYLVDNNRFVVAMLQEYLRLSGRTDVTVLRYDLAGAEPIPQIPAADKIVARIVFHELGRSKADLNESREVMEDQIAVDSPEAKEARRNAFNHVAGLLKEKGEAAIIDWIMHEGGPRYDEETLFNELKAQGELKVTKNGRQGDVFYLLIEKGDAKSGIDVKRAELPPRSQQPSVAGPSRGPRFSLGNVSERLSPLLDKMGVADLASLPYPMSSEEIAEFNRRIDVLKEGRASDLMLEAFRENSFATLGFYYVYLGIHPIFGFKDEKNSSVKMNSFMELIRRFDPQIQFIHKEGFTYIVNENPFRCLDPRYWEAEQWLLSPYQTDQEIRAALSAAADHLGFQKDEKPAFASIVKSPEWKPETGSPLATLALGFTPDSAAAHLFQRMKRPSTRLIPFGISPEVQETIPAFFSDDLALFAERRSFHAGFPSHLLFQVNLILNSDLNNPALQTAGVLGGYALARLNQPVFMNGVLTKILNIALPRVAFMSGRITPEVIEAVLLQTNTALSLDLLRASRRHDQTSALVIPLVHSPALKDKSAAVFEIPVELTLGEKKNSEMNPFLDVLKRADLGTLPRPVTPDERMEFNRRIELLKEPKIMGLFKALLNVQSSAVLAAAYTFLGIKPVSHFEKRQRFLEWTKPLEVFVAALINLDPTMKLIETEMYNFIVNETPIASLDPRRWPVEWWKFHGKDYFQDAAAILGREINIKPSFQSLITADMDVSDWIKIEGFLLGFGPAAYFAWKGRLGRTDATDLEAFSERKQFHGEIPVHIGFLTDFILPVDFNEPHIQSMGIIAGYALAHLDESIFLEKAAQAFRRAYIPPNQFFNGSILKSTAEAVLSQMDSALAKKILGAIRSDAKDVESEILVVLPPLILQSEQFGVQVVVKGRWSFSWKPEQKPGGWGFWKAIARIRRWTGIVGVGLIAAGFLGGGAINAKAAEKSPYQVKVESLGVGTYGNPIKRKEFDLEELISPVVPSKLPNTKILKTLKAVKSAA